MRKIPVYVIKRALQEDGVDYEPTSVELLVIVVMARAAIVLRKKML